MMRHGRDGRRKDPNSPAWDFFFFFAFFCSFSSAGLRSRGQGGRRDNDGRTGLGKEQKIEGGGKPGFP